MSTYQKLVVGVLSVLALTVATLAFLFATQDTRRQHAQDEMLQRALPKRTVADLAPIADPAHGFTTAPLPPSTPSPTRKAPDAQQK
jgi:hypothetical protein